MPTDLSEKPKAIGESDIGSAADWPASSEQQVETERKIFPGIDYLMEQYRLEQNQSACGAGGPNHDIYEPRLACGAPGFTAVPHCMYFYYVKFDRDGRLRVEHYRYIDGDPNDSSTWQPIEYSESSLRPLVEKLARNARAVGRKDPAPDPEENFQGIKWDRKSYIAIFLDEANWALHKAPARDSAVVFLTEPKNGNAGTENHSFFDAIDLDIDMPAADECAAGKRSAIVFVNHMKCDDQGTDLGQGSEHFQFNLFLDVAFATGDCAPMTVIIDPDGTNMGPPVPPPS